MKQRSNNVDLREGDGLKKLLLIFVFVFVFVFVVVFSICNFAEESLRSVVQHWQRSGTGIRFETAAFTSPQLPPALPLACAALCPPPRMYTIQSPLALLLGEL